MPFLVRYIFNTSAGAPRAVAALTLALIAAASAPGANAQKKSLLVDNGPFSTSEAWNATNFSIADDFTFTGTAPVSTIRFWALDFRQGQTFGNFNGTMSWFIHRNRGNNRPGNPVASGFSSAVAVTDTGSTYEGTNAHIFQLDIPTDDLRLNPGRYWLRLKEGTSTEASDATPILWAVRDRKNGKSGQGFRFDPNPVNPTDWPSDAGATDLSFQLLASGPLAEPIEAPEPGTLALVLLAALPVTYAARRRMLKSKDG